MLLGVAIAKVSNLRTKRLRKASRVLHKWQLLIAMMKVIKHSAGAWA